MHEYQKRSSSPTNAALQAYQRKIAALQASSSGSAQGKSSPPKINRDIMAKHHSMMMSKLMQMQAAQQQTDNEAAPTSADVAKTEEEKQDVQAKGDWQQKADTNAIFSNGSALPPALMAKYENLMPGVSLGHVSLHQGSQVDAALGAAKLHGLTDGTNVAVSSKAPQGTLEHEIGHVGQRQEKGFSLNESNRQAYEADADHISAKLLSDQSVERFGQEKLAAKESPDPDSINGEHQGNSSAPKINRDIIAKQHSMMMSKLIQEELSARELLNQQQDLDQIEGSNIEEETSVEERSTKSDKSVGQKDKDDANLVGNKIYSGEGYPRASPPPTGRTNRQAIIELDVFIKLVQNVEKAYPNDSAKETVTRIRDLYYSSSSLAIGRLLPNAPNNEVVEETNYRPEMINNPVYSYIPRRVRRIDVGDATYNRLTSQADENVVYGKPKGDNPSPYILLPNRKLVDVGHLLLTLDAKLNPGSKSPYSSYNVPTIDPASWVADIGIASVWVTTHEYSEKPNSQAPPNMRLSIPPTTSELDEYYKASAPEADLLGNADGFGLFNDWNSSQSLSEALRNYYLGSQGRPAGVNRRWLKFCLLNGFVTNENDQVRWKPKLQLMNEWIPRINNFCNLYAPGPKGAQNTIVTFGLWRYNQQWRYTPYMLNKFLDYVITNLSAELRSGV